MPKKNRQGRFEIDPSFDEEAYLVDKIDEIRSFMERELNIIDNLSDTTFQLICMFAMIDRLAQEEADYQGDSRDTFCQFVLKHQTHCDYIEQVDPITLYYRVEDIIDEVELFPGFPKEKEIDLSDLGPLYAVKMRDILSSEKAEKILEYVRKRKDAQYAAKKAKEHRLINLIYRMRSKAVHEMSGLGETWSFEEKDFKPTEPYYRDVNRTYVDGNELVSDDVIELVIPNIFVRTILVDCIEGYLANCKVMRRVPFSNNKLTRKHELSWYDI